MKKNKENNNFMQQAVTYITYMMVGSYFKTAIPANHFRIDSYYIQYKDLNAKTQIKKENIVDRIFQKKCKNIIKDINDLKTEVHVTQTEDNIYLDFITGVLDIKCTISEDAKVSFQYGN